MSKKTSFPDRRPEINHDFFSESYCHGFAPQNGAPHTIRLKLDIKDHPRYILDIGSGNGRDAKNMAKYWTNSVVLGADISKDSVRQANQSLNGDARNLSFVANDAISTLQRNYGVFDLITLFNTAHHFENLPELFFAVHQNIPDNGIFYVRDADRDLTLRKNPSLVRKIRRMNSHRDKYGEEKYVERLFNGRFFDKRINIRNAEFIMSAGALYNGVDVNNMLSEAGFKVNLQYSGLDYICMGTKK